MAAVNSGSTAAADEGQAAPSVESSAPEIVATRPAASQILRSRSNRQLIERSQVRGVV